MKEWRGEEDKECKAPCNCYSVQSIFSIVYGEKSMGLEDCIEIMSVSVLLSPICRSVNNTNFTVIFHIIILDSLLLLLFSILRLIAMLSQSNGMT